MHYRVAVCLLAGIILLGGPWLTAAAAQDTEASSDRLLLRDRQYRELAREAAEFEKMFGLLKKVVKVVSPAVVHIEASKSTRTQPRVGSRGRVEEAGSGVVVQVGEKFYVLTNRHVIKDAVPGDIEIKFTDGGELTPVRTWDDVGTDIAVMEVRGNGLLAARLGNSAKMEMGDFVIAFGSPFGLSHSVTYGIISAKGRRDLELGAEGVRFQNFIQTDASINPGNSGGPLVNLRGEVIGLNTAIASSSGGSEGIGFAIPINTVMVVARQLIERGTVTRAFLGVNLDADFGPAAAARMGLPRPRGARITAVTENSPAAQAKLQIDDVVIQFGDVPVEDDSHLINLVGLTEVGKDIPVTIVRDRKVVRLTVQVGDRSRFNLP